MAMFMMLSITVVAVTIPVSFVSAQGKAHPPIGLFGNPNDFRPGPPIPSCNADFNQGPPGDLLKG